MGLSPTSHRPVAHSRFPPFETVNRAYVREPNPQAFKRLVGGHVDDTGGKEWLTDTCTLRLSRAFNYAGVPIPRHTPGLRTATGRDRLNYAFAVAEFKNWVLTRFGQPDIKVAGPPVARDKFLNHHGLIILDIHFGHNPGQTWGATGHDDLWDGQTFYDELWGISNAGRDFFTIANGVSLWLMSGGGRVGQ